MIASYAQEAEHIHFENLADYFSQGAFDTALLPQVKRVLNSGSDKVFIVLHLMGSHYAYWDRYPANEAYFSAPGETAHLTGSGEATSGSAVETPLAKRWRDSYDDSIRHTDAVLDQVIELLAQDGRPAALVYASDHGELLMESGCDKRWHGHGAREDVFASALVWLSKHPENAPKARAAAFNATLTVSGKDLFDTLLNAGDVSIARDQGALSRDSWFSPQFQPRKRSVVTFGGLVSADLAPVGTCGVFVESRGERRQGMYEELARGFGLNDIKPLKSDKTNGARIYTAIGLAASLLGPIQGVVSDTDALAASLARRGRAGSAGPHPFAAAPLRHLMFTIRETAAADNSPEPGRQYLRDSFGLGYWGKREVFVYLLDWLAALGNAEGMQEWINDSDAARILAGRLRNDQA